KAGEWFRGGCSNRDLRFGFRNGARRLRICAGDGGWSESRGSTRCLGNRRIVPTFGVVSAFRVALGQDHLDLLFELREFLDDHVPNDVKIDAEVLVNKKVSQPRDPLPGNVRMPLTNACRNIFDCFADDFKISDYCMNGLLVALELFA